MRSLKYLLVAAVNLGILTVLLALWTDRLEMFFNGWVRQIEFLKIIGFSVLSLIAMRILVSFFRRKKIFATGFKIRIAALLTFLVSSYLYVNYSIKVINNAIIHKQARNQLADKIRASNELAHGTKADSLTIKEYHQITEMYWFPRLPAEASNIHYNYGYDGFLPDYHFTLTYDLPLLMEVDTINYQKGDFSRSRSFEILGDKKRVTYSESEH